MLLRIHDFRETVNETSFISVSSWCLQVRRWFLYDTFQVSVQNLSLEQHKYQWSPKAYDKKIHLIHTQPV